MKSSFLYLLLAASVSFFSSLTPVAFGFPPPLPQSLITSQQQIVSAIAPIQAVSSLTEATNTGSSTTITSNIKTHSGSYIRWNTCTKSSSSSSSSSSSTEPVDIWEIQTAVSTFQRTNPETKQREVVELHAQVHYGCKDYFNFYNTPVFQDQQDEVLYELLVDESLLGLAKDKSGRILTEKLQASPNDRSVAQEYGWYCQVDVMDYAQDNWKHADFTRQELLQQQAKQSTNHQKMDNVQPLWQQVSSSGTAFWQPAVSALFVGPPSLFVTTNTDLSSSSKRKLFTNLFLPGNHFAGWLRAMLWMTVPAPEISVLLLDWSSLFLSSKFSAKFSPVTLPILQSLMTLQLSQLRKLVFGQVLVAGNSAQTHQQEENQDWNLLVTQRNDHALEVLKSSLRKNPSTAKRLALLYGCSHCPDLHTKLISDLAFALIKTEWRTAWSVSVPTTFAGEQSDNPDCYTTIDRVSTVSTQSEPYIWTEVFSYLPPTAWGALLLLFPLYLVVGAADWIDTIHSSSVSLLDENDVLSFGGDWLLYLLRHGLLYVGLSKFALEWQDPGSSQ